MRNAVVAIFLLLILKCSWITSTIYKCCPDNTQLTIIENEDSNNSFECNPNVSSIVKYVEFKGYQIENNNMSNIPDCEDDRLNGFKIGGDKKLLSNGSCIDAINDKIFAVTCFDKSQKHIQSSEEVISLQKCCPDDQTYDIINLECVQSEISDFTLNSIVGNISIGYSIGVPKCDTINEVLVEYQSDRHGLYFEDGNIRINRDKFIGSPDLLPFSNKFCLEKVYDNTNASAIKWMTKICMPRKLCDHIPCVRKCCNDHEKLQRVNGKTLCATHHASINFELYDQKGMKTIEKKYGYGLLLKLSCKKYRLDPSVEEDDIHFISYYDQKLYSLGHKSQTNDDYCIEFAQLPSGDVKMLTFVCFPNETKSFQWYVIGLSISSIFLVATLIIYGFIPKLLNLHGKTIFCHCLSLLSAYLALASAQSSTEFKFCHYLAYHITFSFLAAFSWLTVICFDIWWSLGPGIISITSNEKEYKIFCIYSLFAWGLPLIITLTAFFADFYQLFDQKYLPNFGVSSCWFQNIHSFAHLVYFTVPISALLLANFVFFILTRMHCKDIQNDIIANQSTDRNGNRKKRFIAHKARFSISLKVFILMSAFWVMEIISNIVQTPKELFYITDAFNVIQGIFIFTIFVCNKKVLAAIKGRFGMELKDGRTRRSSFSGSEELITYN